MPKQRRKKMSPVIALRQDSDDDGRERPNSASVPSLSVSRKRSLPHSSKRPRDKGDSFNENGPRKKTATGSAADLKGLHATEKDVVSENSHVSDHRKSHEGVTTTAASSQPMNSDSNRSSRNNRSANKHSKKRSTSKPTPNAAGRQGRYSAWKDRLSELADYRKVHGHCNVPRNDSENTQLSDWVANQRCQYWLQLAGKTSPMTTSRIKDLESLDFEWDRSHGGTWEDLLSDLTDYRKIHGHCSVPQNNSGNTQLANWVHTQRKQYRLHLEGKKSSLTLSHIEELESLDFEWDSHGAAWEHRLHDLAAYHKIHGHCNVPPSYKENTKLSEWVIKQRSTYKLRREEKTSPITILRIQELDNLGFEWVRVSTAWEDRLSELADFRTIHGHSNVPRKHSENSKLANWVKKQRSNYWLHQAGKKSHMTLFRIKDLESLDFEWTVCATTPWEDRLSELADYHKIQGHCNVPQHYSENTPLGKWVGTQRNNHRLHREGKKSQMTTFRIQELENLGFEWKASTSGAKVTPKKRSLDDDTTHVREKAVEAAEHVQTTAETQEDVSARDTRSNEVEVALEPEESDRNWEVHLAYIPGRTEEI
jgi:hypothetical protein